MSDVQFDTDNQFKPITSSSIGIIRAENKMAEWLMHKGIAKSESQAQMMLLSVAVLAIAVSVVSWITLNPRAETRPMTQAENDHMLNPAPAVPTPVRAVF